MARGWPTTWRRCCGPSARSPAMAERADSAGGGPRCRTRRAGAGGGAGAAALPPIRWTVSATKCPGILGVDAAHLCLEALTAGRPAAAGRDRGAPAGWPAGAVPRGRRPTHACCMPRRPAGVGTMRWRACRARGRRPCSHCWHAIRGRWTRGRGPARWPFWAARSAPRSAAECLREAARAAFLEGVASSQVSGRAALADPRC